MHGSKLSKLRSYATTVAHLFLVRSSHFYICKRGSFKCVVNLDYHGELVICAVYTLFVLFFFEKFTLSHLGNDRCKGLLTQGIGELRLR